MAAAWSPTCGSTAPSIYMSETNRGDRLPVWLSQRDCEWSDRPAGRKPADLWRRNPCAYRLFYVSAARLIPSLPWVETDEDAAIAGLAVQISAWQRGFKQFGFCR